MSIRLRMSNSTAISQEEVIAAVVSMPRNLYDITISWNEDDVGRIDYRSIVATSAMAIDWLTSKATAEMQ
jgi:hypothetical protein